MRNSMVSAHRAERPKIRDELPADEAAVRAVVTAAFGRSLEAQLVEALRVDGDAAIALVAADRGGVVGHVVFSPMAAPFAALGLAPIAVLPQRQGEGVGSRLVQAGLERATKAGWQAVFVVGEPAFYGRFGFDTTEARGFRSPYAGPYFMVRPLAGPLTAATGTITYAPAFARMERNMDDRPGVN